MFSNKSELGRDDINAIFYWHAIAALDQDLTVRFLSVKLLMLLAVQDQHNPPPPIKNRADGAHYQAAE